MAKKISAIKALEQAQKRAAKQLEETRKRIRKQDDVSSYEYCLLYEDSIGEAKAGARRIDELVRRIKELDGPSLILVSHGHMLHLVLAAHPYLTLRSETWAIHGSRHVAWTDTKPSILQSMEVVTLTTGSYLHTYPLHRLLNEGDRCMAVGEPDVADQLITVEKREGGAHDRFDFFYGLTKQLGYELKDEKLRKRIEKERERATHECTHQVKCLEGLLDELFFRGPREPYVGFKGDASPHLVSRAKGLADEARDTLAKCKLYDVETDASRELAAFFTRWVSIFKIVP